MAILLFGASWPVVKLAMVTTSASPLWLAAVRSCLACVTLIIFRGGRLVRPSRQDMPALLAVGVLQLTIFFLLCHLSLRFVPAGQTAILSNAALIWVVPLAALLRQKEPLLRWCAAAVTLAGVVVIVQPWTIEWDDFNKISSYAALLIAAFAWACTIVITRLRSPRLNFVDLLPWSFAISAAILVFIAFVFDTSVRVPLQAWPAAIFNGMVVAPLGTLCLLEISRRLSSMVSAISFMAIPLTGVVLGKLMLGEVINAELMIGGLLIASGIVVASRS
ncbi:DMT family transporter [Roseicella sp. DB1501]|nr:DMT family transporter [Roseicella sp. DB1501]